MKVAIMRSVLSASVLMLLLTGWVKAERKGIKPPEFQAVYTSNYSFDKTLELLKSSIESQNHSLGSRMAYTC